jgi:hypothetical protein
MRQRMNPAAFHVPKDYRGWSLLITNPKIEIGNLNYLISIRDPAKSGMGYRDNRHLNYFAESINMNVGGFYQNAKVSSPPMTDRSVGGVIVVGARESRVHGKGRQEVNIFQNRKVIASSMKLEHAERCSYEIERT